MDENSERYPGKRSGMPQQEVYTSVAFHQSLQPVIDRLKAEQSEVLVHIPSARELAKLLYDVLGFLESAYGRHALTKPFPKLPYALFQDTRPHGAVDILLRAVAEHVKKVRVSPSVEHGCWRARARARARARSRARSRVLVLTRACPPFR